MDSRMPGTRSLSRLYRPARFRDLVSQAHIRQTLEREVLREEIGHAYLFTGPRGVGKTTTARIFASAINCLERDGAEPCGQCAICRDFQSGRSLDLIEIDAASHTQVDHVRDEIIPTARTRPSRAAYKVFIIDEVHMLSLSAFNALLKIIEEPPEYVVFIFATTEIDRVPETIISRCQRFDFHRLDESALAERLKAIALKEKANVDEEVFRAVAELADGSVRDAESLLGQVLSFGNEHVDLEKASRVLPRRDRVRAGAFLAAILEQKPTQAMSELAAAVDGGVSVDQFYFDLIRISREALRRVYDPRPADAISERLPAAEATEWIRLLKALLELEPFFAVSPIPQLPLELFAAEQAGVDTLSARPEPATKPKDPPKPSSDVPTESPHRTQQAKPTSKAPAQAELSISEPSHKNGVALDAETGKALWSDLLAKAQAGKQALAVLLNVCRPSVLEEGRCIVVCQFAFHKDQLNHPKNRTVVEEMLQELTGRSVSFACELSTEPVVHVPANDVGVVTVAESTQQDPVATPAPAPTPAPTPSRTSKPADADGATTWDQVVAAFGA